MKDNNAPKVKVFILEFTEEEIAVIKAGLQYFQLDDDFGLALWGTMPYATFGSRDSEYSRRAGEIYKKLKQVSKVKPDYGWWGDIERLGDLCKSEYEKAKKRGEMAEKEMYRDYMVDQMEKLEKALERTGNRE